MSDSIPGWEPGRNAVHRLIQLVDVLAIAFNRFRQLSFTLPTYSPPQPFDTAGWLAGLGRLRADFSGVRRAIFQPHCAGGAPGDYAARLRDEAVAELTRLGARDEATDQAVTEAAGWVGRVGTPWEIGTPRPWNYESSDLDRPELYERRRRGWERFEQESAVLQQYTAVRRGLHHALSRAGHEVPREIDQRVKLAHDTWLTGTDHVSQDQLLDWVRETDPAPAPAGGGSNDKGDGGTKRQRGNQPLTLGDLNEALELVEHWKASKSTKQEFIRSRFGDTTSGPGKPMTRLETGLSWGRDLKHLWQGSNGRTAAEVVERLVSRKPDATPVIRAALTKRVEYLIGTWTKGTRTKRMRTKSVKP